MQVQIDALQVKLIGEEEVTLVLSLAEANALRRKLNQEYRALRPQKDWTKCPYEYHANDCDCGGVGGDR